MKRTKLKKGRNTKRKKMNKPKKWRTKRLANICSEFSYNKLIVFTVLPFTVLPTILPLTVGWDLNTRHGSVLCAAELTHALYCYGAENNRLVT
jgi:hypothetical protein